MNIAVLSGGNSSEYNISVKSAGEVKRGLEEAGFICYMVVIKGSEWKVILDDNTFPVNKNTFSFDNNGTSIQFNYAYNIIHGSPGEDGKIQGYLESGAFLLADPDCSHRLLHSINTPAKLS